MSDASFKDGEEKPLRLMALDGNDLAALSALVQDAVLTANEITYEKRTRRFALLLNRFRWEDPAGRTERVQSILSFSDVLNVKSTGLSRDPELVLSLLSLTWTPGDDGTGHVHLTFAGDGAFALEVECLEAQLRDVTRPYAAPSGTIPDHKT